MSKYIWIMVLAIFVAGCAGGGGQAPPVVTDEVTCPEGYGGGAIENEDGSVTYKICSGSFFFDPETIHAKVGQKVIIDSWSPDIPHSFDIAEFGVNKRLPTGQVVFEFTPDQAGTFDIVCSVPGHKEAGMVGILEVEA